MKWAHELRNQSATLPPVLRRNSLDYKAWKVRTKGCGTIGDARISALLEALESECSATDRAFVSGLRRPAFGGRCGCCVLPWLGAGSAERAELAACTKADLDLFCHLNATTVYKVCKRIDKKACGGGAGVARRWLHRTRAARRYRFMGGAQVAELRLRLPAQCPVCLEAVPSVAVAWCGHHLCVPCVRALHGIAPGARGTLENLVTDARDKGRAGRAARCPMCRARDPFRQMSLLKFP